MSIDGWQHSAADPVRSTRFDVCGTRDTLAQPALIAKDTVAGVMVEVDVVVVLSRPAAVQAALS